MRKTQFLLVFLLLPLLGACSKGDGLFGSLLFEDCFTVINQTGHDGIDVEVHACFEKKEGVLNHGQQLELECSDVSYTARVIASKTEFNSNGSVVWTYNEEWTEEVPSGDFSAEYRIHLNPDGIEAFVK